MSTKNSIENQIAALLQKHFQMNIHDFFCQPMDIRGHLFTTIFMDFLGKDNFGDNSIRESIDKLNKYVSDNKKREQRMDAFMETLDKLRHAHAQKYPEVAIDNINRKALTYYIDISFGMDDPEMLFYNTKANVHFIDHLFQVFTGHAYNAEFNGLVTHVAGYLDAKLCYPNQPINNLESLDKLMKMMQETIRQTTKNLERDAEALIKQVTEK